MQRHRAWLNEFKEKVKQKKESESFVDQKAQEKFLKVCLIVNFSQIT